ncbi:radical SAM protein [Desulfatibacillum aliphaticivorans]|uniref:radical SAM protein n=1 Tax=Desulfatibacillum aliphaticivorans TaxID=218208 RepID=UPI0003FEDFBD|nr:radical SAM protein [Desulfatibacillum aliphaticivorans]
MYRLYQEDPEFGEFSRFDSATGRLSAIDKEEFVKSLLGGTTAYENGEFITRVETTEGDSVFIGKTRKNHTRFPRRVYFQITRNCNLKCSYCFIKSEIGLAHVPTQAVLEMASFLGQNGLVEVRLTGGEPTTHPDFFRILDAFQEQGVYVSVATNGVMPEQKLMEIANRNCWTICSLDGDEEAHNKYRPSTFNTIIRNLRLLRSVNPEMRLRLTTVLTRANMNQIEPLGRIVKELGAESITFIPLRPQVRNLSIKNEIMSSAEFKWAIGEMVRVMKKLKIRMTTTLTTDFGEHFYNDPVVKKLSACAAGREATNLDYDAKNKQFLMYGCSYSPASDLDADPNIRNPFMAGKFSIDCVNDFLKIWHDDKAWTIFRDPAYKSKECLTCQYYTEKKCIGSCPIQNIDYGQINASEDVLKQLKEQMKHNGEWYCYQRIFCE